MDKNYIYKKFQENKQLFKPYVAWPDCVHLGLNNVDAISNTFLSNLQLKNNEHVLWVSYHRANWSSADYYERVPSGCIITDARIYYRSLAAEGKCFEVAWTNIFGIFHEHNTFYVQKSENRKSYDFAISDYAIFNKKINNDNPVVAFLNDVAVQFHCQDLLRENKIVDKLDVSTLSSQEDIKKAYKRLQVVLKNSQGEISELKGVNSQFNTIKEKIAFAFDSKIKDAQKELDSSLNDTVWDNLVIAFFGETNAGKSTIIETFRILFDEKRKKEDGLIVGDGRHDFTKTYEEYHLAIAGHSFTLIDVPGIEGDEAEFKDVIKTALHKAHCVFYIQGHNKKPDRATAEKIKKYLGDWVKVYSIYNVRGGVSNYDEEEERETLLTSGVLKSEKLIRAEFKSILGDVYAGHVTLQGLLAMSAKASFSSKREDLFRGQQKLLKYFDGSADKVLEFSQFKTLVNLVEEKSSKFKLEIIEANKQKLVSLATKISKDIETEQKFQKDKLSILENNLHVVEREVCNNSMDSAIRNITNKTKNAIDIAYGSLKSDIFGLIDKESDDIKNMADYYQNIRIREIECNIKAIVNSELRKVRETANRKIKGLDGINLHPITFKNSVDIKTDIDFSGALEELDIDFNDVVGWVAKTATTAGVGAAFGSVIPFVGTLVGAGVGAVVGGIAHACSGDGGKADARKSVSDAIGKAKQRAKNNVASLLRPILKNIEEQKRKLHNSVKVELTNIEDLQDLLDGFNDDMNSFVELLKHKSYGRI